jgi:hypothetical protein
MGKFGKMIPMLCCIFDTTAHVRDIPNKFLSHTLDSDILGYIEADYDR